MFVCLYILKGAADRTRDSQHKKSSANVPLMEASMSSDQHLQPDSSHTPSFVLKCEAK